MRTKYAGVLILALFILAAAFCICPPTALAAQTQGKGKVSAEELSTQVAENKQKKEEIELEEEFARESDSYIRHMAPSDTKCTNGKVKITKAETDFVYKLKIFDKIPLNLSTGSEYIAIDNTNKTPLPSSLTSLSVDIETFLPIFNIKNTYFSFGISPSLYAEKWHFRTSSFRIPQRYLLIYQPVKKLSLIAGVAIYPEYDNMIPAINGLFVVGLIYKPNDKWLFNLAPSRPSIEYMLTKKLTLFTEGGITGEEFEATLNEQKNRTLCYNETFFGGGLRYQINRYFEASLQGGYVMNRSFLYRDNDSDKDNRDIAKVSIKNGAFTEFRIVADF